MSARLLLALAACALATPAFADVTVESPWSRATPPGAQAAAAYMTLSSKEGDTLTGISSPAAAEASIHEMRMDGPVMRMRDVPGGLKLPPGQAITLAPGGYHVMLTGLKAPLKPGGTIQLRLTFANSPPQDVTAPIATLGATTAPHAH